MKDFKTVIRERQGDLEEDVKRLITDGWEPVGSVNVAYKPAGTYMICESSRTYSQSLVKD